MTGPEPAAEPGWRVDIAGGDARLARVHESVLTLADGRLGTRGSTLYGDGAADPDVFHAGVYVGTGPRTELARLPSWARLGGPARPLRRVLDLRSGVLYEGPSVRFSSLARPGTVALRVPGEGADARCTVPGAVTAVLGDRRDGPVWYRIGAYDPDPARAATAQAHAEGLGFDRLLDEHRRTWQRRWAEADIRIDGDPRLQHAVRFALFHLMASVGEGAEAAVGARGLSGSAYRGHVFWDSDVFVLPVLAASHPEAARAMLEYRSRCLPAALENARSRGRTGARYPWESAGDGTDVTPASARLPDGQLVPIRTGQLEEHIVADVAWAADRYLAWTGDADFADGPGRDLLVQTARYWASRVRLDGTGGGHVYGVIGPDEYHEAVDDNAYTNVMARWNLRRAATCAGVAAAEARYWRALADALVDGYDRATGRYEQFAGFFGLEPVVVAKLAPRRPIAGDLLLGTARTARAQVVKQADVLMLHHLLPDAVAPGSLVPNLDFYEPRTAHGSSLSPAVHAALFARAGRYESALHWLHIAAGIDLDDLTATTAGGLHLAAMGGVWQALVYGFGGVQARPGRLVVDPRLPPDWDGLELNLRFHGTPLRLRMSRSDVELDATGLRLHRAGSRWEVVPDDRRAGRAG